MNKFTVILKPAVLCILALMSCAVLVKYGFQITQSIASQQSVSSLKQKDSTVIESEYFQKESQYQQWLQRCLSTEKFNHMAAELGLVIASIDQRRSNEKFADFRLQSVHLFGKWSKWLTFKNKLESFRFPTLNESIEANRDKADLSIIIEGLFCSS